MSVDYTLETKKKLLQINKCVDEWKNSNDTNQNVRNNKERKVTEKYKKERNRIKDSYVKELDAYSEYAKKQKNAIDRKRKVLNEYLNKIPDYKRAKGNVYVNKLKERDADIKELDKLSVMLLDDTLWAKIKILVQICGYYSFKAMMSDYLTEIEIGKQYCRKIEKRTEAKYKTTKAQIEADYKKKLDRCNNDEQDEILQIKKDALKKDNSIDSFYNSKLTTELGTELYNSIGDLYRVIGNNNIVLKKFAKISRKRNLFYIGDCIDSLKLPENILNKYRTRFHNAINQKKPLIKYPIVINMEKAIFVEVFYDDATKSDAVDAIQNITLRYISSFPKGDINVTIFDPKDRGSNLGTLSMLCKSEGCPLIDMPVSSVEDINKKLSQLDKFVEEVSIRTANYNKNIYDYNAKSNGKIRNNIIIIYDYPNNFDNRALAYLQSIINNAEKCGISILLGVNKADKIKSESQAAIDIMQKNGSVIEFNERGNTYCNSDIKCDFYFQSMRKVPDSYITEMAEWYKQKPVINNKISECINRVDKGDTCDASKELKIPFAINKDNEIDELALGGALSSFMLISGVAGSGKSSLLHSIIASIAINYSPEDVEIWLVDYKLVEFNIYENKRLPHIKFIGLDDSFDFTYGFLEYLNGVIKERQALLSNTKAVNIQQYNQLDGMTKIPRIILIIDELHKMAQALEEDLYYKTMLENIVSEGRAFGLSCVFADQNIAAGLKGLTPKAKEQFANRIAMKNLNEQGIKDTLELPNSYYDSEFMRQTANMRPGEAVIKRALSDKYGADTIRVDFTQSIYIDSHANDIDIIQQRVTQKYGKAQKELKVFKKEKSRPHFDIETIKTYYRGQSITERSKIILGTPNNLKKFFEVELSQRIGQNILLVAPDSNLRFSLIWYVVLCLNAFNYYKITLYVNPKDPFCRAYENYIDMLSKKKNINVLKNITHICEHIYETRDKINKIEESKELIICLSMDFYFTRMGNSKYSSYDKWKSAENSFIEKNEKTNEFDSLINRIDSHLTSFGIECDINEKPNNDPNNDKDTSRNSDDDNYYDARDDLDRIVTEGPLLGYHVMTLLDSAKTMRRNRVTQENYEHLFISRMSSNDAQQLNLYKHIETITKLSDNMMGYNDGGLKLNTFTPFLLPQTEK